MADETTAADEHRARRSRLPLLAGTISIALGSVGHRAVELNGSAALQSRITERRLSC
jgi:hypothetical protein